MRYLLFGKYELPLKVYPRYLTRELRLFVWKKISPAMQTFKGGREWNRDIDYWSKDFKYGNRYEWFTFLLLMRYRLEHDDYKRIFFSISTILSTIFKLWTVRRSNFVLIYMFSLLCLKFPFWPLFKGVLVAKLYILFENSTYMYIF